MKTLLIIAIIFSANIIFPQKMNSTIKGKIINSSDNTALEGVNIYLSGTLIGTSSNKNGEYEISNIPSGNHQIVISMVGYKTIIKNIFLKNDSQQYLNFQLLEKPIEIDSISIISERPDEWYDYYEVFEEDFLGNNEFTDDCVIENKFEINFEVDEFDNLNASIDKPLIITNYALGYKIECELINYRSNLDSLEYEYLIQPKFTELKLNDDEKEEVVENRIKTYKGSFYHFLKCLINNNWNEEGFNLVLYKNPNEKYSFKRVWETSTILSPSRYKNKFSLFLHDYLRVVYNYEEIVSWLKLFEQELIIDEYGYPVTQNNFTFYGDWANYGVAKLLPRYVDFEKELK